jgi:hypothetical protein
MIRTECEKCGNNTFYVLRGSNIGGSYLKQCTKCSEIAVIGDVEMVHMEDIERLHDEMAFYMARMQEIERQLRRLGETL